MITIIYNHTEKSMKEQYSSSKGLLGYDKSDKTFACDNSDLDCAGVKDLPHEFTLEIKENKNKRVFRYDSMKKDSEEEIQYWLYKSADGFRFMVFND
jgi:hypothetical protein